MGIETSDLLARFSPSGSLGSGGGGDGLERKRLKLLREQFEETKRQNAEDNRYRQMALLSQQTVAEMRLQQQREQQEAERKAVQLKVRQEAIKRFGETVASGDVAGVESMLPELASLGMSVERLGTDETGLPTYQLNQDAEESARAESAHEAQTAPRGENETAQQSLSRLGAMGYPTNERGAMDEPVGIPTTEEAFRRAGQAGVRSSVTGQPVRTDPADLSGAVPSNVYDMGAMQSETLRRLDPIYSGLISGMPSEYQAGAASLAGGLRQSGLPMEKQLAQYQALGGQIQGLTTSELGREEQRAAREEGRAERSQRFADAQAARESTRELATMKFDQKRFDDGKEIGKDYADELQVQQNITNIATLKDIEAILDDDSKGNDHMVVAAINRLMGEVGTQTEKDTQRVLGTSSMSWLEQAKTYIEKGVFGGFTPEQKEGLRNVLQNARKRADKGLNRFLSTIDEQIDAPDTDPNEARGLMAYRRLIPKEVRDLYDEKRGKKPGQPDGAGATGGSRDSSGILQKSTAGSTDFDKRLNDLAYDVGLDADAIRNVISRESGGKAGARNRSGATGIIQFMPKTAEGLGTTTEELAKMSAEEQLPYAIRYFIESGMDEDSPPEDYAVAVAAPAFVGKPDDTVVYEKGSEAWKQNKPWRPRDGGDITVGSIKAAYAGKGGAGPGGLPEPQTAEEKELYETLKGYR